VSVKQPRRRSGCRIARHDRGRSTQLTSADLLRQKFPATASRRDPQDRLGGDHRPASARSGTRPRSRPGSIPHGSRASSAPPTKSLPLGEQYSLTLQNGYNIIQQGIVPVPGIAAHPVRNYETEQSAKLSIADTGTSLTAGQSLSSTEDKWLRKIGAEQKLFGGVTINGSIGETALGTSNKSLTAGFKHSW
jgi:hypothetical protein